ncbi:ABC-three component system middle component 7 [Streptococcus equi]|uniref:ABC-three component system middle component 7 n=1 Tax=Streptococcus equi TaxID=1336 RepID=UPI0013F61BEE|nr:ABC-three component system middle component 7 [Streptococcus equi]
MKLPNKAVSYRESILFKIPFVLEVLEKGDYFPQELFRKLEKKFDNIVEFTDSLTCLYALGQVDLTEDGALHYVERNKL